MLILLLILPLLGKILSRARRLRNHSAEKLRGRLGRISNGHNKQTTFLPASFAALIVALAQPAWNPHPGPMQAQGRDMVIALDISRSMLAADVFPTRLDAVKIALFESLEELRGQRIGLITFAGAASVRVPLTLDHNFVRYMLERAQPSDADVGSTSLQAAIEKAIDVALSESQEGKQDIIVFTDGEDHISDIETTADELRECGARVLIIGLGDPVAGAKIPAIGKPGEWMQYDGRDVITRLDANKLLLLSSQSPNVIYHAARTRPFDLIALYQQMIADTADLPVSDETQLVYTEGYPVFIALALILWLIPLSKRLFPVAAMLMLMAGCSPDVQIDDISEQMEPGHTLWAEAQDVIEPDPGAALAILKESRGIFLQVAMKRPGNPHIAQQIAGLSIQIRKVEKAVQAQEEAEKDLHERLQEAIEQLKVLTQRETALFQKSQKLLRRHPAVKPEEKAAAVEPSRAEQAEVSEGTVPVLDTVVEVQGVIQKMLKAAYGDGESTPPTEFDDVVTQLSAARQSQQTAINNLKPDATSWPQANSAFHSATRQMQEALRLLSEQNQGQDSQEESDPSEEGEMDWEFDEDMEWSESDMASDMSMPMESGSFKSDLNSRSLPTPNYTAEEILMEEAANMEQRAQQQSGRAGAKVEKNW